MTSIEKALFPGMVAGVLFLLFFTSIAARPAANIASRSAPVSILAASASNAAQEAAPQAAAGGRVVGRSGGIEAAAQLILPQAASQPSGECQVSLSFPESVRRWCSLIDAYAREHGVEPNLVAAVMLQESGGNPDAYSKSGAVGLLQVMPRDGLASKFQCINGPCFADRPSMDQLYDPEYNIAYGVRMLSGLIRRYGNERDALKAYGPMDMGYRYADIVLSIFERYRQ